MNQVGLCLKPHFSLKNKCGLLCFFSVLASCSPPSPYLDPHSMKAAALSTCHTSRRGLPYRKCGDVIVMFGGLDLQNWNR